MVTREGLGEQFSHYGIDPSEEVLEKCWEVCIESGVGEEEFLEIWMAYSVSRLGGEDPTVEFVDQMVRSGVIQKSETCGRTPKQLKRDNRDAGDVVVYELANGSPQINDIFNVYCTTPKACKGTPLTLLPDNDSSPISSKNAINSSLIFSPASYSPVITTRSSTYCGKENAGHAICTYNVEDSVEWRWSNDGCTSLSPQVNLRTTENEDVSFKEYMCDWLGDVAMALDNHLKWMEKHLSKDLEKWEHEPIDQPCVSPNYYLGRICCDGNGRLNMGSLLLEGLVDCTVNGKPVQLDVSRMLSADENRGVSKEPCAFFPGQVVVVKAENHTGSRLLTSEVHSKASAPLPLCPPSISSETGPLRVIVGAGPFTQSDSLSYEPLQDLVSYVCTHQPHVVILIGPFLDSKHPQFSGDESCQLAETFETYFDRMMDELMGRLQGLKTRVILVASARDAHSVPVYPTPPHVFPPRGLASKHLVSIDEASEVPDRPVLIAVSDPCLLDIAGVVIGVTSTDILMHLGREEIASDGHNIDRLGRLSRHLIHQRNFYPMYPPALGVNTDMAMWSQMCTMPVTPHTLILPSDLRGFIKDVEGCLVMNPGRLTKGVGGGSFAKFEVCPPVDGWQPSLISNIRAQILKM